MSNARLRARVAIESAVSDALREILAEYAGEAPFAIDAVQAPPAPDPVGMAAAIGFRSLLFSGSLSIHASGDVVLGLSPPGVQAEGPDWIAELANQLMGRAKNKILRLGVPFWARPATPTVCTYAHAIDSHPALWFRAATEHGAMHVLLQSNCPEDLLAENGEPIETLSEGDCLMF